MGKIPNNSNFKNLDNITYKVLFRKPDKRWYGKADGVCGGPGVVSGALGKDEIQ